LLRLGKLASWYHAIMINIFQMGPSSSTGNKKELRGIISELISENDIYSKPNIGS
jgi:hypothetical protein